MLRSEPHRGVFVPVLDQHDIEDISLLAVRSSGPRRCSTGHCGRPSGRRLADHVQDGAARWPTAADGRRVHHAVPRRPPLWLGHEETTGFCLQELDFVLATLSAPEETAAIIVEPVLGEGGYIPATPGFVAGLRERCDRHGMLLIVDEIQTGVGRTGWFWGHEHFAVRPDVLVTAKGLASGFPLSAFAAPHDVMARGQLGSHGGTYGGNAVACAAALATLEVIADEGLVERSPVLGLCGRA